MRTTALLARAGADLRRGRLTRRVFWDLAVYMVGMGIAVGLVFPPFAIVLGVPERYATRPAFEAACLAAGFLVGALSCALCRWVVGGRLAVLSESLRLVAEGIARASRTGDWSGARPSRIVVDSDDELGETARAFNSLLDAIEDGEHFRSLVRNASDVITVVDAAGTISYQTPSVTAVLGYPPAALLGTDVRDLVHPDDLPAVRAHLSGALRGAAQPPPVGCRVRHHGGSWLWVETVTTNLLADRSVGGLVLTTRDVSERKELEELLRTQAHQDPLTGLPNRALFMERLAQAERARTATGTPAAVLFIDLDDLKALNGALGHEGGDTVLRTVAERIRASARGEDVVARLSGDEFAVLLVGARSEEQAPRVAARVLAAVQEPVRVDGRDVRTGVSVGIATSAACETSGTGLLRAADTAMYRAKSSGKGRAEVFAPPAAPAQRSASATDA